MSPSNLPNSESHQYTTNKSYIMIELELDKPLVAKRSGEVLKREIASYLSEKFSVLPKKTTSAEKAVEEYHKQLVEIAQCVIGDFAEMFKEEIINGNMPSSVADFEKFKDEFYYMLNSTGKFFAFKERLKYSVIRVVREKFYRTNPLDEKEELQLFLRDLYVYLVKELHVGLKALFAPKELSMDPSAAARKFDPEALYRLAKEAESYNTNNWASKYYQERIAKYPAEASHWKDYAVFFLNQGQTAEAHECFRESLKLNPNYNDGILGAGLCSLLECSYDRALSFLESVVILKQTDPVLWVILAMFYNVIGDQVLASMATKEARCLEEASIITCRNASKEATSLESASFPNAPNPSLDIPVETAEDQRPRNTSSGSKTRQSKTPNDQQEVGTHLFEFEYNDQPGLLKSYQGPYLRAAHLLISMHFEQFALKVLATERVRLETLAVLVGKKDASNSLDLHFEQLDESCESGRDKLLEQCAQRDAELLVRSDRIPLIDSFAYFNEQASQFQLYMGLCDLGNCYKESSKALNHLRMATKLNPESCDAWTMMGHVYATMPSMQLEMKRCYERALDLQTWPTQYQPEVLLTRLGSEYLQAKQFEKAKKTFLHACEIAPTARSWLGVGVACYRLDELVDAEQALAEANSLNNREPDIWAYLSMVCLKSGRLVEAEQCFKYAVKMGLSHGPLLDECLLLKNQ
ncbi:Cilia- and flagella-associated protein 70 [Cichlidogyrus casuarinus]|uniref:Cilia- and flagella-associated protein 70 n=1 Tax=Cichlidogyrus casuarinus TaxID=1844966 RepID=A0ABD2QD24_9PLAT